MNFLFHDEENIAFSLRISRYLEALLPYFPYIKHSEFNISSENSFPHSSGIASSASGMSALALCLCSIENELTSAPFDSALGTGSLRLRSGHAVQAILKNSFFLKHLPFIPNLIVVDAFDLKGENSSPATPCRS